MWQLALPEVFEVQLFGREGRWICRAVVWMLLLQTPLVVSSFLSLTVFYWLHGPPVVLKGTPQTQARYHMPNPSTPLLTLSAATGEEIAWRS